MCGVVAALGRMDLRGPMKRLAHRGIRGKVTDCEAGAVGHVRLPIVGLGEEHDQPMQRNRWTIGFVGELLDFREKNPGYECDAELVADIWAQSGPHGLRSHDGFWGIVAIDNVLEVLHVVTDYLGQKPMYYREDFPIAASEPDALVCFGSLTLDKTYLSAVVKWGYCPDVRRTPYNEIKHVPPGGHVILAKGVPPREHVSDPVVPMPWSNVLIAHEIEAAVERRVLSSDVPVACLVSGGLDSAIVYMLARRYGQPVPYCVVTDGDDEDYWKAQYVVNAPVAFFDYKSDLACRSEIPIKKIRYDDVVNVPDTLAIMQEPIDLGSLRPQVALANAVQERVCLTGDGADEVFGGYGRSMRYDSQYTDVFQELPAWHLPRLDRVMMRNRVEVRSPFLARNVVRMALSLPHELRKDKRFLRALFTDILPPRVTQAPKKALRTAEIEHDREGYSQMLVGMFTERFNENAKSGREVLDNDRVVGS